MNARRQKSTVTTLDHLDPRTPVIVGVGQASERPEDSEYRGLSPVALAAEAARAALADSAADIEAVAQAIDTVAGVRQFEIISPYSSAPLGKSDNYPRSVADLIGADPARAILEVVGGQGPQHLVTEFAGAIADGSSTVTLLFGSDATSTTRLLSTSDNPPDFTQVRGGTLEDRGYGIEGMATRYAIAHHLRDVPSHYSAFDNARRARLGLDRTAYARQIGELLAPLSAVAAKNPHAAAPTERTPEELTTVTERNRLIVDQYPRFVIARDQVNQGAAILLMSVGEATRLGVPQSKWVFLRGHADLREKGMLDRVDLSTSRAADAAVRHALDLADIGLDDVATFDFYSCFPIAVLSLCDSLGLSPTDPRGLTVTGGLPFFGGAGNGYAFHAIAETVDRMRADPGTYGVVGATGGSMTKYSVGVYSTDAAPWTPDRSNSLQAELDAGPDVTVTVRADGPAEIETYTVLHGRKGKTGIVIGRLGDGSRFLANTVDGDDEMLALLSDGEPLGRSVFVRSTGPGNRVAVSEAAMNTLIPRPQVGFRESYDFVQVIRDDHVLHVIIDRPDHRNTLPPEADAELDHVFDAYFADSTLWVAILSGAGADFCTGTDLQYLASGRPMWLPTNGSAGLTGRADMSKPIIAAVNGTASGTGFEIALACHLTVAGADARFALDQSRTGQVAESGGLARLQDLVSRKVATELAVTGRTVDAHEALALGLVNRLVPAGSAVDGAYALAADILQASPVSVTASLRIMADPGCADAVLDELMSRDDMLEGVTATVTGRTPKWRNR